MCSVYPWYLRFLFLLLIIFVAHYLLLNKSIDCYTDLSAGRRVWEAWRRAQNSRKEALRSISLILICYYLLFWGSGFHGSASEGEWVRVIVSVGEWEYSNGDNAPSLSLSLSLSMFSGVALECIIRRICDRDGWVRFIWMVETLGVNSLFLSLSLILPIPSDSVFTPMTPLKIPSWATSPTIV